MTDLHVTLVQSTLHWENIDRNLDMFGRKLDEIKDATDLIVLPEMFSTGFTMNAESIAEEMDGKSMQWLAKKAKEKSCVITGSLVMRDKGHYYNRMIWMRPDGTFEHYDKRHLFRMASEHEHYTAGTQRITLQLKGWKVCPLVCYDLRFPVWSRNSFFGTAWDTAYDVLIYTANWPSRRSHPWKTLLLARAIENQCYVIGVNRVGKDGKDIEYSGDSAAIDAKGEIISSIHTGEESIETVTLSWKELDEFRKAFPVGMDADHFEVKG
jgi:predicted amidohydrolase